jgi:hypothetical protein
MGPRLERAISGIDRPETDAPHNYFQARLPDQFDAVRHYDQTRAAEPLERTLQWQAGESKSASVRSELRDLKRQTKKK